MKLILHLLTCNDPSPYTGRVYPLEEVKKMVNRFTDLDNVQSNISVGILVKEGEEYCADMPLHNVSHILNSLYFDDNNLMAEVTLLDTPAGQFVKENIDLLRLSPAMYGNFDKDYIHNLVLLRTDFLNKGHINETQ